MKTNVLVQYSWTTLAVTTAASLTLGILLSVNLTNYEVQSHVRTFPPILRLAFQDEAATAAWLTQAEPVPPPAPLLDHFRQLLNVGKIYRIKIWSLSGQILWSDSPGLIGQRLESAEMREAVESGLPVYEIGEVDKAENATEQGHGTTLQIYVPVSQKGQVLAVAELYEDNRDLWTQIAGDTVFVGALVAAFGLLLYLSLFGLFYRAWKTQSTTNLHLEQTQDVTVFALAYQAELRDHETGLHLERTAQYVKLLAQALHLGPAQVRDLVKAAPLHDIGKVGVPDAILLKAGPLTPDERLVMQTHCELGDHVLEAAEQKLPFRSFLTVAREVTLCHHEKWDGTGYPKGLKGESIPLGGRLMAIADVYDALRSERPYKRSWSHADTTAELKRLSGTHFDPKLVEAYLSVEDQMSQISDSMASPAPSRG